MSSIPNPSAPMEQRLLAAIVFTDVAGFSSRVEVEESVTLGLLERDFKTMRLFATSQGGTVIKTTGDGLLIYFTSAVEAVEWALKTQRHFADQATELQPHEYLRHRIGIHVGDITVGGGDVMGDGVNVAARVQTEARAGGICVSQVVYGMVKNKLKLDVVRLETRKLKNISENVQMYHVLLEPPPTERRSVPMPVMVEAQVAPPKSMFSAKNLALFTLVLAAIGGAVSLLIRAQREHEKELAGSADIRNTLAAALRPADPVAPPAKPPVETPAATPRDVPPVAKPAVDEFDFLKLALNGGSRATPNPERARQKADECIRQINPWITASLGGYTRERPLRFEVLRTSGRTVSTVYTDANRGLVFVEGGATRSRPWADLTPEVQGAILAGLLMGSSTPLTRDIVRGAEAFAFVNDLPELAEKLVR